MKNIILVFCFLPFFVYCQPTLLDQKNGFRNFKIGDNIKVHEKHTTYLGTSINANTKIYSVNDTITVLSNPAKIELITFQNLILGININFDRISYESYDEILQALENLYGKSVKGDLRSDRPIYLKNKTIRLWNGEKLGMQFTFDSESNTAIMVIWSLKQANENYNSEF